MTTASVWEKAAGIPGSSFHIGGPTGPVVSASSGALEARASDGSSLTVFRAAPPVGPDDVVNLTYAQQFFGGGGGSGGVALSAGSTLATSGTVIFSNSNNVSFGLNGRTVTASASYSQSTAPGVIVAGTQTLTSGTLSFANSNGVSFGLQNGSLTASVVPGAAAGLAAISAGAQTVTSGTLVFSNSNGVSFGIAGQTITASMAGGGGGGADGFNILAAGTQTAGTATTVIFSNSNNVTFGMQGNSQITASASYAPTLAFWENLSGVMFQGSTFGSLSIVPLAANVFPGLMTARTFLIGVNGTASQSTASGALNFSFGIYTLNVSTLSLLNSVSTALSWAAAADVSSMFTGPRWLTVDASQWSAPLVLSQTNYWLGYAAASSNATQGLMWVGQNFANAQARWGTLGVAALAPAGSYGWRPLMGAYTAATAALPSSIAQGDLNASATLCGNFLPHVMFNNALSMF
jgi:hypothetical protein